jgi:hypothetical protein
MMRTSYAEPREECDVLENVSIRELNRSSHSVAGASR